jgi:hypothetical protein
VWWGEVKPIVDYIVIFVTAIKLGFKRVLFYVIATWGYSTRGKGIAGLVDLC